MVANPFEFVNLAKTGQIGGFRKAKQAYGWPHSDGADKKTEQFVAALEIPLQIAVKMAIYSDSKKKSRKN